MRELAQTFSYIVEYRGGTYCSQVKSNNLQDSLQSWFEKINEQKAEIKFLGEGTLKEIADSIRKEEYKPVVLQGLKNVWFIHIPTRQGGLNISIVQTDIS